MKTTHIIRINLFVFFSVFAMVLSGCSGEYLNSNYSRSSSRAATPKIPEIRQQPVVRSRKQQVIRSAPQKATKPNNYSISSSVSRTEDIAMNKQKTVVIQEPSKTPVAVEVDPYAGIPEASITTSGKKSVSNSSSPAIQSLMIRARADLAVGRTQSAVSKLERGLRIESQNPSIWHLLAKAHFDQGNHQQSIAMAKKSIRYSGNDKLIAQNWTLIKKAGEKSEDTIAIKEALDYFKVNP